MLSPTFTRLVVSRAQMNFTLLDIRTFCYNSETTPSGCARFTQRIVSAIACVAGMAGQIPPNSVWSAMNYTPPRGQCNHKHSLMSPACACLRFMLHPVKAATSFECDGCGHHASFHSLENPAEDAVIKKWSEQEAGSSHSKQTAAGAGNKKRRLLAPTASGNENADLVELDWPAMPRSIPNSATSSNVSRGRASKKGANPTH
ncbi:hypothetical protein KC330_g6920 [Hortaea werneckii]|nr:hypothetical protein KC330_g6920 [Hortaea werneckii]